MNTKKVLAFWMLLVFPANMAQAYWVWSPEQGKFVNADGATQDSAEEEFDYGMKLYREKNLDAAEETFQEILKKYPRSAKAPEAQYRLGMVLEEKGEYLKAYKSYKRLVESYPQSERFNEVIEREFRIGNVFLSGKKAKFAGLEILPSLPKAVEVFKHITTSAPYSDFGDKAQFQLGLAYKKWRHYGDAVESFQSLIDQYPKSELISQARYELAECSFLRSTANARDQRALDDASKQVTRYLDRYPDTNTSEKAAVIRQQIDEKNAEKNFRIGLYYEKDNYIESALIYYADVAARYPDTQWGSKAAEKMKSLKQPAEYVQAQERTLDEQEQALRNKLKALEQGGDPVDMDITKRSLERLEKHRKTLAKDKKESMERRKDDLARRERELKQKFKNLENKKKLLKKNPSEDLERAIERWNSSLVSEEEALKKEREQLQGWREELGMKDKSLMDMSFLPFVGEEPSEIEKVRQIEAKKFYKLSEEKKSILEEKETLYKHHSEVSSLLHQDASEVESPKANELRAEIIRLEKEIHEKDAIYEKSYGKSILSSIAGGMRKSLDRSIDIVNPFDSKVKVSSEQQLLERQMHFKERIAAQEGLVQTLTQAFDAQIALQEQKRILEQVEGQDKVDPKDLRKKIRALERQVRGGYEEVEARHNHKQQLLKELDRELKQREQSDPKFFQAARILTAPAAGAARLTKAFFVGLPNKDVELTKTAAALGQSADTEKIKKYEEEIRTESMIIEAKSREIMSQRKELEILKAQASLEGGYKFRSVFIDVPYMFFDEALESAKRIVPKKKREEVLINRINQETKRLEALRAEQSDLEKQVSALTPESRQAAEKELNQSAAVQGLSEDGGAAPVPAEGVLESEIQTLRGKLETQRDLLRQEQEVLKAKMGQSTVVKGTDKKKAKKLAKELKEIEEGLEKIIRKETELEGVETEILEKRISHIDKTIQKVRSKSISQDLLTEKERMVERLSQLESRKDFLSKELQRFQPITEVSNTRS